MIKLGAEVYVFIDKKSRGALSAYPPDYPIFLAIARIKLDPGRCATCSVKWLYLGLRVVMVSHLGSY